MPLSRKKLDLEFTTLHFYEDYVISQPKEGIVIRRKEITDIVKVCSDHYKKKKFVYLSYRIHKFSVDPMVYIKLKDLNNLVGIGVVSRKASSLNTAVFESNFTETPYAIFLDIEKAQEWVKSIVHD